MGSVRFGSAKASASCEENEESEPLIAAPGAGRGESRCSQLGDSPMDQAQHRPARHAGQLRDLLSRMALIVMQEKHFAFIWPENPKQLIEVPFHSRLFRRNFRHDRILFRVERFERHHLSASALIDEEIPHRGKEKRARFHPAIAAAEIQPAFLHEILRIRGMMRQRERIPIARLEQFGIGKVGMYDGRVQARSEIMRS